MSFDATFDRRAFLAVTGGAAVAGAIAPLTASQAQAAAAVPAAVMIGVEEAGDLTSLADAAGARLAVMARTDDPVRFWRREVAPALTRDAALAGVTLWSDFLVFRDLAAEARLSLVSEARIEGAAAPLIAWRFA